MTKLPSSSPDVRDDENPLGRILGLAAAALGVLTLLLGFAPLAGSSAYKGSTSFYGIGGLPAMMLVLLLAGGLLAAAGSVPKLTSYTPVAAVLVVAGFLGLLVSVIAVAGVSGVGLGFGAYIVLLFALLLVVATVGALLIEVGIITPQQRPAQSGAGEHYGQPGTSPYGPGANPGPFGAPQQGGYGARAAPQGQGFPQQGPGRYGPPAQQQYGQPSSSPNTGRRRRTSRPPHISNRRSRIARRRAVRRRTSRHGPTSRPPSPSARTQPKASGHGTLPTDRRPSSDVDHRDRRRPWGQHLSRLLARGGFRRA